MPTGEQPGPRGGFVIDAFSNFSSTYPPYPLLTQTGPVPEDEMICPKRCNQNVCFCVHLLKVKLNSIVELVLTDGKLQGFIEFECQPLFTGKYTYTYDLWRLYDLITFE